MPGTRMVVVWCPDWPVVAWGIPAQEPAAVVVNNRVVACSAAARSDGVATGQRRREAQGRCPGLAVVDRDVEREARLFEPVVVALEELTPRVELTGPGLVGFPSRGPSRFFGGDQAMTQVVADRVAPALARHGRVSVAVADGVFAARLAARRCMVVHGAKHRPPHRTDHQEGVADLTVIEPGTSADFLSPLPIGALEMPELTGVLSRLGLTTLGRFAALESADVLGRFGAEGRLAHRLARGEDDHPPDLRSPAPDLAVSWVLEPPAEKVDQCALIIRSLTEDLHHELGRQGLACTRVAIEIETENGERHMRLWRHQGTLSAAAVADRARWQLDGWLNQAQHARPSTGILRITIIPDEVVPAVGYQLGFWGVDTSRVEDVTRMVARLQALIGADAVTVPEFKGGLVAAEQLRMIPAAAVDLADERLAATPDGLTEPWPGRIPAPSPVRIRLDAQPVELVDATQGNVQVSGRGELNTAPCRIRLDGQPGWRDVTGWAGPWPAEQRWWDPLTSRRRARMQVVLDDDTAHLLMIERGEWFIEATYD